MRARVAVTDMGTDTGDEARRWRKRAEEVRTLADQFRNALQREELRRIAKSYDTLADGVEGRLRKAPRRLAAVMEREAGTGFDPRADRRL